MQTLSHVLHLEEANSVSTHELAVTARIDDFYKMSGIVCRVIIRETLVIIIVVVTIIVIIHRLHLLSVGSQNLFIQISRT